MRDGPASLAAETSSQGSSLDTTSPTVKSTAVATGAARTARTARTARATGATTAPSISGDRLLADRGLYSRALASYTATSFGVGDLLDLLLYAMVLPDLVGYYALVSGFTARTVVLSVLLCQLSLGLAKTYGTLFFILSLKLSRLAMDLGKSSSGGIFHRTARRLVDKLSLMTNRASLRNLMKKDDFKRIVKNIDSLDRLRKDNRRMSTVTSVLLGFLHSLCRYLGLGKLANKVKTIVRDRRLARGLAAQGPVRRESIGNMRRSRGLLGLVNRIRANRIAKAAGLGEGKGGKHGGKDGGKDGKYGGKDGGKYGGRARELAGDRRGRAEDRENARSSLERIRKLEGLLADQDYSELLKRAGALSLQRENGENLSLKDRLAQEIAVRQLVHDFSGQLMKDLNTFDGLLNLLGIVVNAMEIVTGLDINGDGRIGGALLGQLGINSYQQGYPSQDSQPKSSKFGRKHGHHSHGHHSQDAKGQPNLASNASNALTTQASGGPTERGPEWEGWRKDEYLQEVVTPAAANATTPRGVEKTPAASATTEEPAAQTTSMPDISDKSWFKQLRSRKAGGPAAATSQSTPDQQQPAAEKVSQNPPPVPQRPSRGAGRGR